MAIDLSLRARIILSGISGIGCTFVWFLDPDFATLPENLIFYGLSGLFFAGGVLFPYVDQDKFMHLRAVVLVIAAAVGYWGAVVMTIDNPFGFPSALFGASSISWLTFISGSLTGGLTVMVAVAMLAPLRISLAYAVLGVLASTAGGIIARQTFAQDGFLSLLAGYVSWHVLICLAIYFGTPSTSAGAKMSARFVPERKRNSVPDI